MTVKKIPVVELFGPTIQGEGALAGQVSYFVRSGGCPYRCTWCFGVMPGRHVPKVITAHNPNKKINEVSIGDVLLTFDEHTKSLVETTVIDTGSREVDIWLRLTIDGKQYFLTEEHPFFTTRGLLRADELIEGDMVLHANPSDKLSWSKLGKHNPMKRPEVAATSSANRDVGALSRALQRSHQRRREAGILVGMATWSEEKKRAVAALNSARMSGEGNPNWKGGAQLNFTRAKREIAGRILPCDHCGHESRLEIHHKDEDQNNDDPANFERICHACHSKEHKRGRNFWQGPRRDGKEAGHPVPRNGKEVQAIKRISLSQFYPSQRPNPLRVYNLTCSPYNSYLVDYMWVHNCDSMHAVDPKQIKKNATGMTQEEIVAAVVKLRDKAEQEKVPRPRTMTWVTLTGGDPVMWPMDVVVSSLYFNGFRIAVETQGSLWQDWLEVCDLVTCSPKPPSSGMADKFDVAMIQKYWARLGDRLAVKVVVFDGGDLEFAARVRKVVPQARMYLTSGTPQGEYHTSLGLKADVCVGYRQLAEMVLRDSTFYDVIISPQLHVLAWGTELGR